MVFDTENKVAYIISSDKVKYSASLLFEKLYDEIVSECVANNCTFQDYINKHQYITKDNLINDFNNDYIGIDYITNNYKKVDSKILYRKENNIYIKNTIFENNIVDYISTVVPDLDSEQNDLYLYLIPLTICKKYINDANELCVDNLEDSEIIKIKFSEKKKSYYNIGFKFYYRKNDIQELINAFENLTGYKLEIKNIDI